MYVCRGGKEASGANVAVYKVNDYLVIPCVCEAANVKLLPKNFKSTSMCGQSDQMTNYKPMHLYKYNAVAAGDVLRLKKLVDGYLRVVFK